EVADVPGEPVVHLVGQLVAGDVDLLGVDHDDVVAGVDVRGVDRLVLAAQAARELGAQAAPRLAGGVDDVPVALDGLGPGGESLHDGTLGSRAAVELIPAPRGAAELRLAMSSADRKRRKDRAPDGVSQVVAPARPEPSRPPAGAAAGRGREWRRGRAGRPPVAVHHFPNAPSAPRATMSTTRLQHPLDHVLDQAQRALETVFGSPPAARGNPAGDTPEVEL